MKRTFWRYGPAALCRMDKHLLRAVGEHREQNKVLLSACLTILFGTMCYGASIGMWRAPIQALYSALKMPVLIFSTTFASSLINTMLAQVMGSRLSFRLVWLSTLLSLAIASALLGALSPVVLFFATRIPAPSAPDAGLTYSMLLLVNTLVVGICGVVGTCRLLGLLITFTGSVSLSAKILLSWIMVSGLTGSELSWIISPFLARPGIPIPLLNPNAFRGNIFEYLWSCLNGSF